ncbi:MAG: class I SAM-dependent methyltransferase [Phycisphaerae bacterium]
MNEKCEGHEQTYRRRREQGAGGWFIEPDKFHEPIRAFFRERHRPTRRRLLELGCGAGEIACWLAGEGYAVTGVDISETALQWTRRRAEQTGVRVVVIRCDWTRAAPFEDEAFDIVLDSWCLHCIVGADRSRYLANVRRVLAPGGAYLLFTGCRNERTEKSDGWDPRTSTVCAEGGPGPRCYPWPEQTLDELRMAGFESITHTVRDTGDGVDMLIAEARRHGAGKRTRTTRR